MTITQPAIAAMKATLLRDNRRVVIDLTVSGLPSQSNVMLLMPDAPSTSPRPPEKPDPNAPSPYPNVELSLVDEEGRKVTDLYIVEHQEETVSLTLHIPRPRPGRPYTARAELTHEGQIIDVAEVPFVLAE